MIPVPIIDEMLMWGDGLVRVEVKANRLVGHQRYVYFRAIDNDPTRLEPAE